GHEELGRYRAGQRPDTLGTRTGSPRGVAGRAGGDISSPGETIDPRSGARPRTAPLQQSGGRSFWRRRMNIREAAEGLRARRFSAVELANAAISRIDRHNPDLRAFITITAEQALHQARQADGELALGKDRGPLHGIPVALKDLFGTRGVRTTAGSKVYEDFVPQINATVVERLLAAGAVLLGKLNMHELAYGITSANPHFGAVCNPWNPQHSPGGSSGGSGAAVAAGMGYAGMGTDTGGSIRIPASFCGTVGLKPTYGRVSRYGVLPLGFSQDHMGPLARSVRDAALALNAIAGHDPRDQTSSRRPVENYVPHENCDIARVRIGFPDNFFFDRLDRDVEAAVRGGMARAESLGAEIRPVRLQIGRAHV